MCEHSFVGSVRVLISSLFSFSFMYQGNLKKGIELEMVKHTESNKDFSQQVDLEKF